MNEQQRPAPKSDATGAAQAAAAHLTGRRTAKDPSPSEPQSPSGLDAGVFVILLLLVFAVAVQTSLGTLGLMQDRDSLTLQIEQQTATLNEAQKVRAQLEAVAGDTAILAEAGNQNAIQLRDFLAQQGLTLRAPTQPQ